MSASSRGLTSFQLESLFEKLVSRSPVFTVRDVTDEGTRSVSTTGWLGSGPEGGGDCRCASPNPRMAITATPSRMSVKRKLIRRWLAPRPPHHAAQHQHRHRNEQHRREKDQVRIGAEQGHLVRLPILSWNRNQRLVPHKMVDGVNE